MTSCRPANQLQHCFDDDVLDIVTNSFLVQRFETYKVASSKGTGKKKEYTRVKSKCIAEFNTFSLSTIFFQIYPKELPFSTQKKWVNPHIRCHSVRDFELHQTNLVQRTLAIFAPNSQMLSELKVFKCSSECNSPSFFLSTAHTFSTGLAGSKKLFETKSWECCGWSLKFLLQVHLISLANQSSFLRSRAPFECS